MLRDDKNSRATKIHKSRQNETVMIGNSRRKMKQTRGCKATLTLRTTRDTLTRSMGWIGQSQRPGSTQLTLLSANLLCPIQPIDRVRVSRVVLRVRVALQPLVCFIFRLEFPIITVSFCLDLCIFVAREFLSSLNNF